MAHDIERLVIHDKPVDKWKFIYEATKIDRRIGGPGLHLVLWERLIPRFPYSLRFDGVARPLRYVPFELVSIALYSSMARSIVANVGGFVDECVIESAYRDAATNPRAPGTRVAEADCLPDQLKCHIRIYYKLYWNVAKHEYAGSWPSSVLSLCEGMIAYFTGRSLGVQVLRNGNRLRPVMSALGRARKRGCVYNMPSVGDLRYVGDTTTTIRDKVFAPGPLFVDPDDVKDLGDVIYLLGGPSSEPSGPFESLSGPWHDN